MKSVVRGSKKKPATPSAARRFRYYVSISLDGFIADANGGVDFLTPFQNLDYGMKAFFQQIDTIIYGRKTLFPKTNAGAAEKMPNVPGVDQVRNIVLSRTLKEVKGAEVAGDAVALVRELRSSTGKDIWLMGGGDSAAALLEAGGLDEIDLHRVPVLLGSGIPLFGKLAKPVRLQLVETEAFPNGVVRELYRLDRRIAGA